MALALTAGCLLALAGVPAVTNASAAAPEQALSPAFRKQLRAAARQIGGFKKPFQARVWLLDMSTRLKNYVPDADRRTRLLKIVHRQARRHDLDPQLVLAVMTVESHFQRFAISSAGARGLMQIMPFWKKVIGRNRDNLFNVQTNLRYGCTILAHYLEMEDGNMTRALARYNGSLGSYRYPGLVYEALRRQWAVR